MKEASSTIVASLRHICETLGILTPRLHRPFRFLDLPAEIRLLVYKELFGGSRAHIVWGYDQPIPAEDVSCEDRLSKQPIGALIHLDHDNSSCRFQSAILRACRTVYHEALPVLYANPIFSIQFRPYCNAIHIRRIIIYAKSFETLKEQELAQQHTKAGLQWDKLQLCAVNMENGLGTGIVWNMTDSYVPQPPIEYKANDIEWLYKAKDASELKRLGLCLRPFPQEWLIRKGSTRLHHKSSDSSINYYGRGACIRVVDYSC
jgi:hypothetical protein